MAGSVATTPHRSQCTQTSSSAYYEYTLDVVSNGSEATEPTIFLSVLKRSSSSTTAKLLEPSQLSECTVVGRYAVLGLGDMTARLVADQKFSWASTKAVFCHNNHRHGSYSFSSSPSCCCCNHVGLNGGGYWGFPSLLLELNRSGASTITLVAGNEDDASIIEEWMDVFRKLPHPRLDVTAVPFTKSTEKLCWWKMYEDDHILVHATCHGRLEHLVYLVTCRQDRTVANYTVVILPCPHARTPFLDAWKVHENRVILDEQSLAIHAILTVGKDVDDIGFHSEVQCSFPGAHVFFCTPQDHDEGILMRATSIVKSWQQCLPQNIVWHERSMPTNQVSQVGLHLDSCTSIQLLRETPQVLDRKTRILERQSHQAIPNLEDVQSLRDFFERSVRQHETSYINGYNIRVTSRLGSEDQKETDENEIDIDECDDTNDPLPSDPTWNDQPGENANVINNNNNDDDDDDDKATSSHMNQTIATESSECSVGNTRNQPTMVHATDQDCPYLLVLGTGCSAPSPVRGSSGYGLLMTQVFETMYNVASCDEPREAILLTAIVECGEGVLSMLQRHLPSIDNTYTNSESLYHHLRHVKFIWVSHAHWDHYGGLAAVLSAICEARIRYLRQKQSEQPRDKKRQKRDFSEAAVLIVAPKQVLKHLAIALRCNADIRTFKSMTGSQLYQGFTHEENLRWWPWLANIPIVRLRDSGSRSTDSSSTAYRPFAFWANIRVEHCSDAFGFVMGLRLPNMKYFGDYCGASVNYSGASPNCTLITFAYSGDTRPCLRFVDQCRLDCSAFSNGALHFLLHEASFDDPDQPQCLVKQHSSLSEALDVAASVNAQNVILTHFSQRNVTHPPMKLSNKVGMFGIAFAMDGMLIPLTNISVDTIGRQNNPGSASQTNVFAAADNGYA